MSQSKISKKRLLLNCDMGESFGPWRMGVDEQVMPLVDMANIACGFHASDPVTMSLTMQLAMQSGTRVGAHPGYPDLVGFGRRSMQCSNLEIISLIRYQIGALHGVGRALGVPVTHVKPHGALYNDMMRNHDILRAVLEGVAGYDRTLPLMVSATADNSKVQRVAENFGVPLIFEAFADRAYDCDGLLVPRSTAGAVYHDEAKILEQSLLLAREGVVETISGDSIKLEADTLCVHGDNAGSVEALKSIRMALDQYYDRYHARHYDDPEGGNQQA